MRPHRTRRLLPLVLAAASLPVTSAPGLCFPPARLAAPTDSVPNFLQPLVKAGSASDSAGSAAKPLQGRAEVYETSSQLRRAIKKLRSLAGQLAYEMKRPEVQIIQQPSLVGRSVIMIPTAIPTGHILPPRPDVVQKLLSRMAPLVESVETSIKLRDDVSRQPELEFLLADLRELYRQLADGSKNSRTRWDDDFVFEVAVQFDHDLREIQKQHALATKRHKTL